MGSQGGGIPPNSFSEQMPLYVIWALRLCFLRFSFGWKGLSCKLYRGRPLKCLRHVFKHPSEHLLAERAMIFKGDVGGSIGPLGRVPILGLSVCL
jgi:hypothetical protein